MIGTWKQCMRPMLADALTAEPGLVSVSHDIRGIGITLIHIISKGEQSPVLKTGARCLISFSSNCCDGCVTWGNPKVRDIVVDGKHPIEIELELLRGRVYLANIVPIK